MIYAGDVRVEFAGLPGRRGYSAIASLLVPEGSAAHRAQEAALSREAERRWRKPRQGAGLGAFLARAATTAAIGSVALFVGAGIGLAGWQPMI